jgi:predicted dehydrogenase
VGGNVGDKQGTRRDLGGIQPYNEFQALLAAAEVDMVDICAPTFLHKEIALAALAAGKHVLCEKPMALSVEDCDAMIGAAKQADRRFMIAQCIRWWPQYVYLKGLFDSKEYGDLKALHLRRQAAAPDYTLGNWILNPELSGGAVLDLHVHDVDYALFLLGLPKAVTAQGYARPGGGVDRIHALWHYGDERVVDVEGFWDMPTGYGFNMGFTAVFDNAAVVWDMSSGKPLAVYRNKHDPQTPDMQADDGYFGEIEYFLGCVARNEDPQISTPQSSRDAVMIALAEKRSALTGKTVNL